MGWQVKVRIVGSGCGMGVKMELEVLSGVPAERRESL